MFHEVWIFPVEILHLCILRKALVTNRFVTSDTVYYFTSTEMVYICPLPVNWQGNI